MFITGTPPSTSNLYFNNQLKKKDIGLWVDYKSQVFTVSKPIPYTKKEVAKVALGRPRIQYLNGS